MKQRLWQNQIKKLKFQAQKMMGPLIDETKVQVSKKEKQKWKIQNKKNESKQNYHRPHWRDSLALLNGGPLNINFANEVLCFARICSIL